MQEYKGIITGIGDKLTGDNLIQPQLDAYWRDFVVGGNAILHGLNLEHKSTTHQYSRTVSGKTVPNYDVLDNVSVSIHHESIESNPYTTIWFQNDNAYDVKVDCEIYYPYGNHAVNTTITRTIAARKTEIASVAIQAFYFCAKFSHGSYLTFKYGDDIGNTDHIPRILTGFTIPTVASGIIQLNRRLYNVKNVVGGTYNATQNTITWSINHESYIYIDDEHGVTYDEILLSGNVSYSADTSDASTLLPGECLARGYIGYFKDTIPIDTNYVYGRFVINHNSVVDKFSIVTFDTIQELEQDDLEIKQDDILNEVGEYWLLLYSKELDDYVLNPDLLLYPDESIHSDESDVLLEGGTIARNAVAVTQKVDDDSDRVATTQYVANQIKKDINAGTADIIIQRDIGSIGGAVDAIKLTFLRKARIVGVTGTKLRQNTSFSYRYQYNPFSLPIGFEPISDLTIYLTNGFTSVNTSTGVSTYEYWIEKWIVKANQRAATFSERINIGEKSYSGFNTPDDFEIDNTFFYETNT